MRVYVKLTAGPSPDRQQTVFISEDEYLVATLLDAVRFRTGYRLPDDLDFEMILPPTHQKCEPVGQAREETG